MQAHGGNVGGSAEAEPLHCLAYPEALVAVRPGDLLLPSDDVNYDAQAIEVRRKAKILEKTFADFGFTVKV